MQEQNIYLNDGNTYSCLLDTLFLYNTYMPTSTAVDIAVFLGVNLLSTPIFRVDVKWNVTYIQ